MNEEGRSAFRANLFREATWLAACLALVIWAFIVEGLTMRGLWVIATCSIFALAATWLLLSKVIRVEVGADSIHLATFTNRTTIRNEDVSMIEDRRCSSDSSLEIYTVGGKSFTISPRSYRNHAELIAVLLAKNSSALSRAVAHSIAKGDDFGVSGMTSLTVIAGAVMSVIGIATLFSSQPDLRMTGFVLLILTVPLFFLVFVRKKCVVRVTAQDITIFSLARPSTTPWREIRSVILTSSVLGESRRERIQIIRSGKDMWIGDERDRYGLLREVILSQVPADRIIDNRD